MRFSFEMAGKLGAGAAQVKAARNRKLPPVQGVNAKVTAMETRRISSPEAIGTGAAPARSGAAWYAVPSSFAEGRVEAFRIAGAARTPPGWGADCGAVSTGGVADRRCDQRCAADGRNAYRAEHDIP